MSKDFRVLDVNVFAIKPHETIENAYLIHCLANSDFETFCWADKGFNADEIKEFPCRLRMSVGVTKKGKLNFSILVPR